MDRCAARSSSLVSILNALIHIEICFNAYQLVNILAYMRSTHTHTHEHLQLLQNCDRFAIIGQIDILHENSHYVDIVFN